MTFLMSSDLLNILYINVYNVKFNVKFIKGVEFSNN